MELYHQTLLKPTTVLKALRGHWIPSRTTPELCFVKQSSLELWEWVRKLNREEVDLRLILTQELATSVCTAERFPLTGEGDILLVSVTSGQILLLYAAKPLRLVQAASVFFSSQVPSSKASLTKPLVGTTVPTQPTIYQSTKRLS
ncbi:unnamed protein product [Sphagnum balticum]